MTGCEGRVTGQCEESYNLNNDGILKPDDNYPLNCNPSQLEAAVMIPMNLNANFK